ncbi:MAG: hypothetical protein AB7V22_02160 [Kiritimatiellia bacterium]
MNTRTTIIVVALLASAYPCHATEQIPDLLVYNSTVYELPARQSVFPLEDYYITATNVARPAFSEHAANSISTALWRGYIGIWEIRDGSLFLIGIQAWLRSTNGVHRVSIKELFDERCVDGRVPAIWYSGAFTVQESFGIPQHDTLSVAIHSGKVISVEAPTEDESSQQDGAPPSLAPKTDSTGVGP